MTVSTDVEKAMQREMLIEVFKKRLRICSALPSKYYLGTVVYQNKKNCFLRQRI